MEAYLIIDIGTSSLRVAAVDENLQILHIEVKKRFMQTYFDAEAEWQCIKDLIGRIMQHHCAIRAIAVSSLLGWVGVDHQNRAVTPCYSYMHQSEVECCAFRHLLNEDEIYKTCGICISPEWAAWKLLHLKQKKPDTYQKIMAFLSLKDFIALKLTGVLATDHTTASYSMLYDVTRNQWSTNLLRQLGLDGKQLPQLKYPYEILAPLLPEMAHAFSLEEGTPVIVGSVDGTTGIFGVAVNSIDLGVSIMGTTDVFYLLTDKPFFDPTHHLLLKPYVLPGVWMVGGPMGMFGGCLDWLIQNMANSSLDMRQLTEKAAALAPGCNGLLVYPSFTGERAPFWNPHMLGTITGFQHMHTLAHVFRAVMEANGYATNYMIQAAEQLGITFSDVLAIGGGAKNDLWLQIRSDITGKSFHTMLQTEATLMGGALLAQLATGKKTDQLTPPMRVQSFTTDKDQNALYEPCYQSFLKRHATVATMYD